MNLSENEDVRNVSGIVLCHKENKNKTGFPYGVKVDDEVTEAIGIIESFEKLTSPRRKALSYFEALSILKKDVDNGIYDKKVFDKFVLCLGSNVNS